MRVSTRVEYGLIALMDIALHSENGSCVATWEIARRQNISKKYLEQILPQLRTGGFIKAQKGIRGGYTLACCNPCGYFECIGHQRSGRDGDT